MLVGKLTVQMIVQKYQKLKTVKTLSGRGRKQKTSKEADELIAKKIGADRGKSSKVILQEVATELGVTISERTTRRRLIEAGYYGQVPTTMTKNSELPIIEKDLNGDVHFVNIHFVYPLRSLVKVLNGLNFTDKRGETVTLCGNTVSDGIQINQHNVPWLRQHVGG
ncbi:unnamed protein product, partial [Didymodactylos carnosus]